MGCKCGEAHRQVSPAFGSTRERLLKGSSLQISPCLLSLLPFCRREKFRGLPPFIHSFIHSPARLANNSKSAWDPPNPTGDLSSHALRAGSRHRGGSQCAPDQGSPEVRRWGQTWLQPGWRRRCGRGGRQFRSCRCCRTRRRSGCAGD